MSERFAAVLFDMDGTLVDSEAAVARVWAGWARRRGADPAAIDRLAPGRQAVHALADLAPGLSEAERAADARMMLEQEYTDLADVVPAAGARELLDALDVWAIPYAVVTSADDRLAAARLGAAGIVAPPITITASAIRRGKPDPEGFREAAHRLGVRPHDCLVVEDSPAGVQAARAAGATVAGLRGVPGSDLDVPDLYALLDRLRPSGRTLTLIPAPDQPSVAASERTLPAHRHAPCPASPPPDNASGISRPAAFRTRSAPSAAQRGGLRLAAQVDGAGGA